MKRPDLLGLVQRTYDLAPEDDLWLGAIGEELADFLDDGLGVAAWFFDARDPKDFRVSRAIVLRGGPEIADALAFTNAGLPADIVLRTYCAPAWFGTVSQTMGMTPAEFLVYPLAVALAHPFGAKDLLALKAMNPAGEGIMVGAALREPGAAPARSVERWAKFAAHLTAALRLRRALGADRMAPTKGAEAVLDAKGRVVHAESAAKPKPMREALAAAAKAAERAKGPLRREDPDLALEIWRGLVAGRWSLIEHFEADGKRFLVARKNDPDVPDPRALSLRERQVLAYAAMGHPSKLIAYELGLSPTTVATHLARGMAKIGISTRAELVRMFGERREKR